MSIFKTFFHKRQRKIKPFIHDSKYRIVPAFEIGGTYYYMFSDEMEIPTGRQLAAVAIYSEMEMRVDRGYLEMHTRAMDKILSNPAKIDLTTIMRLNINLKERLELMVLPDFVYKLASVIYFDETESPFMYDAGYNVEKIKKWKEQAGVLDFFSKRLLGSLIPFFDGQPVNLPTYLQIADQVEKIHQQLVTDILSD